MKFWAIFGFELGYQARRASTWLYFAVLLALTLYVTRELSGDYARSDHSFSNAPFYIAVMSLVFGTMGLLIHSFTLLQSPSSPIWEGDFSRLLQSTA
jgi:ABC-2 type transport system permease protein